MMPARTYRLLLLAFLVLCFSLAARLQPQFRAIEIERHQSGNFFSLALGDCSRIFANSFFVKADAYYHSGYYPTIFDNRSGFQTPHLAADTGAVASHNQGEEDTGFLGPPRNWIDAFGRHFIPYRHTHLDEGGADDLSNSQSVREILPWLKISAELDPHNIDTFVVTAFWLRTKMHNNAEAEQVLRDGLRRNPKNPQLLFELGRVYLESYADTTHARNIWNAALPPLQQVLAGKSKEDMDFDDRFMFEQLQTKLGELEEYAGDPAAAIAHWQQVKAVSPQPDEVQKRIDRLQQKISAPPAANGTNLPTH